MHISAKHYTSYVPFYFWRIGCYIRNFENLQNLYVRFALLFCNFLFINYGSYILQIFCLFTVTTKQVLELLSECAICEIVNKGIYRSTKIKEKSCQQSCNSWAGFKGKSKPECKCPHWYPATQKACGHVQQHLINVCLFLSLSWLLNPFSVLFCGD